MQPFMFMTPEEFSRMQDQAQMNAEVVEHEIMEFLHKLPADDLLTLNQIIHRCADHTVGAHMTGLIRAIMHFRHGTCKCGIRHEQAEDLLPTKPDADHVENGVDPEWVEEPKIDDSLRMINDHSFTVGPGGSGAVCTAMVEDADGFGKDCGFPPEAHAFSTSLDPTGEDSYTPTARKVMSKYNVAPKRNTFPRVVCLGCGLEYPNLRDRMLKGPDDCHGCHIKAAQG